MGIRSLLAKPFAAYLARQTQAWAARPGDTQRDTLAGLVRQAAGTRFGRDHGFESIRSHDEFKRQVPIRDYENLKNYIEEVLQGKADVLWPGKPAYFAKTSGTTSGTKYIPLSKESAPTHFLSARNATLSYVQETGKGRLPGWQPHFLIRQPAVR